MAVNNFVFWKNYVCSGVVGVKIVFLSFRPNLDPSFGPKKPK